jgi:[ribosomal protein S18]-alanine N-acetyltransferase
MIEITLSDAHGIASIMPIMECAFDPAYGEAWSAAQCLSMLTLPDSQLLIAHYDGAIAGFAISRWVLDEEELMMIGVSPEFQRLSIGQHLLNHVIENAKKTMRIKLYLEVRANNSAIEFYRSMLFTQIGSRPNYYLSTDGTRYDATTMQRIIQ